MEATGWLWLLLASSTGLNIELKKHSRQLAFVQVTLLALISGVIVWPVFQYEPNLLIILEFIILLFAGFIYFFNAETNCSISPSLTLAVSSTGLALVTALGGSVLVGQMAGALASILGAFALYELYRWFTEPNITEHDSTQKSMNLVQLVPAMQIYLALLFIARTYAEIPLMSATLLLIAPLIGLLHRSRFSAAFTGMSAAAALVWLLATADSSSYY
jgi:ABC-type transport system involved in cytochrome c biogenesis permease component